MTKAITTELKEQNELIKDEATILISQALDKNVPVESLERLLAMRRELKQEKAKEEYDRAMASFQSACPTIEKKTQGYNYKYADLTTIIEQVKELLSRHGFSYTFDTDEVDNAVIVSCKVKHIAGHMEISKAQIRREATTKMNASQQSGAAMTYGKRYAFINAFGILTGEEDNDGATVPVNQTTEKIPQETSQDYVGDTMDDVKVCSAHDMQIAMQLGHSKSKNKDYWYHRNEDGQICFGSGYLTK